MKSEDVADRAKAGTLPRDPADESTRVRPLRAVQPGERDPASQAERALVGALVWAGRYEPPQHRAKLVETTVESRMFRAPPLGAAFAACLSLEAAGAPTEPIAVASEARRAGASLDGQVLDRLSAEADAPTPEKLAGWAREIRTGWLWRQLGEAGRSVSVDASAPRGTPAEAIEAARLRLEELAREASTAGHIVSVADAARQLQVAMQTNTVAFSTGFDAIDDATGGLRPRETSIVAARTSVGKSALAAQIARNMITLRPEFGCLYVSLEMGAESFSGRLIAADAGIRARKIRRPGEMSPHEWTLYTASMIALHQTDLHFVDSTTQTLASVQARAAELVAKLHAKGKRLALVVIDHIGLVKPSSELLKNANRQQQVAETSRGLRYLAERFDCHVIGCAQIGREAEKNVKGSEIPKLWQISESGTIENDADATFILHRERDGNGLFVKDKPPALVMAKARHDAVVPMLLSFDPTHVRFGNHLDATTFYDHYGAKR